MKKTETIKLELDTELILDSIREGLFKIELLSLTKKGEECLKNYIEEQEEKGK